jgi:hypothetical protein
MGIVEICLLLSLLGNGYQYIDSAGTERQLDKCKTREFGHKVDKLLLVNDLEACHRQRRISEAGCFAGAIIDANTSAEINRIRENIVRGVNEDRNDSGATEPFIIQW